MKKYILSEEESALFRESVRDVTPLNPKNKLSTQTKPFHHSRVKQPNFKEPIILSEAHGVAPVLGEDYLFCHKPGVSEKMLRRLKRGQIRPQAELDLHACTMTAAENLLGEFLIFSQKQQYRVVRVIHGKGGRQANQAPILKNAVNRWLQSHPAILAFCSSIPRDGGTGAIYILFKSNKLRQ